MHKSFCVNFSSGCSRSIIMIENRQTNSGPPPAHPFPISTMSKSTRGLPRTQNLQTFQRLRTPPPRPNQWAAPQREAPYTTLPRKPSNTYLQKNDTQRKLSGGLPDFRQFPDPIYSWEPPSAPDEPLRCPADPPVSRRCSGPIRHPGPSVTVSCIHEDTRQCRDRLASCRRNAYFSGPIDRVLSAPESIVRTAPYRASIYSSLYRGPKQALITLQFAAKLPQPIRDFPQPSSRFNSPP